MIEQSCVICGITVPGPHVTCSSICRAELKSNKSRRHDARRNERMKIDADYRLRRKEIVRQSAIRNGRTKTEDQREIERLVRLAKAEEKIEERAIKQHARQERKDWRLANPEEVKRIKIEKREERLRSDSEYATGMRIKAREYHNRRKDEYNAARRLERAQETAAIAIVEGTSIKTDYDLSISKTKETHEIKSWHIQNKAKKPTRQIKTKEQKAAQKRAYRRSYMLTNDNARLARLERDKQLRTENRDRYLETRRKREAERRAALIVVRELSLTGD